MIVLDREAADLLIRTRHALSEARGVAYGAMDLPGANRQYLAKLCEQWKDLCAGLFEINEQSLGAWSSAPKLFEDGPHMLWLRVELGPRGELNRVRIAKRRGGLIGTFLDRKGLR